MRNPIDDRFFKNKLTGQSKSIQPRLFQKIKFWNWLNHNEKNPQGQAAG
jgi:hypothetical protein